MGHEGDGRRLSVLATAREAYAIWFGHMGLWLKLSAIPAVCLLVLGALLSEAVDPPAPEVEFGFGLLSAGGFLIFFLSEIPLATAWHRLILMPADPAAARYAVGRPEWLYLRKILLLLVMVIVISIGVSVVMLLVGAALAALLAGLGVGLPVLHGAGIVSFALLGIVAYLFGHIVLVLPAAAIGRKMQIGEAAHAIGSNAWPLVWLYVIAYFPVWLFGVALSLVAPVYTVTAPAYVALLLQYLPELVFTPVIVGILSVTFRELVLIPEAAGSAGGNGSSELSAEP